MTNILVDTNILVYSLQSGAGEKNQVACGAIQELISSRVMSVSTQNLAELCRVLLEKSSPSQPAESISKAVVGFSKVASVLHYTDKTVVLAISISSQYQVHFFDALLAATMQENSINEILTENTDDFSKIPWIKARNPFVRMK